MYPVTKAEVEGVAEWFPVAYFALYGFCFKTTQCVAWLLRKLGV